MAHLTKYTKAQLPHLLKHDSRAKDKNGNYIRFGNEEIDTSRTELNYNLHERGDGLSDYEYIKRRGEQYLAKNVVNRSNINWCGSWVITLPESLKQASDEDQRRFFVTAHEFLVRRYGYDNVVGAYVHMDETTPHMHAKITPVLWDEKKGKFRHSAKDMFDKGELYEFHQHLSRFMEQEFGFDVGVVDRNKDKSKAKPNKSISELKAENKKLAGIKDRAMAEAGNLLKENERLREKNALLRREMDSTSLIDGAKKKLVSSDVDRAMELAEELTEKRTAQLQADRDKALSDKFEIKEKYEEAVRFNKNWKKSHRELESKVKELEKSLEDAQAPLREENESLKKEVSRLRGVVRTLQRAFDRAEQFLKDYALGTGEQKKSMWERFKNLFRDKNKSQYDEFQDIRHDKDLYAYEKEKTLDLGR